MADGRQATDRERRDVWLRVLDQVYAGGFLCAVDRRAVPISRGAAAVAILVAGYLGINPPGFVAEVVAFAFGLAAASFFPAIIMGIFYKKMNKEGAISGMLAGMVFTVGYIIYFKGIFITPMAANVPENWLFGISPEGIGSVGMVINFVVAFVVSRFTATVPHP